VTIIAGPHPVNEAKR